MWLMTTSGFYSVVEKKKGEFQIRARQGQDLKNARTLCLELRHKQIIETPTGADYRYRIVCTRDEALKFIATMAERINYSNFKDAVHKTPTQEAKGSAYMQVWSAMGRLQPGGPYGRNTSRPKGGDWYDRTFGEPTDDLSLRFEEPEPEPEPKRKAPTKWRAGADDGQLHVVANSATQTHRVGRRMFGLALCGAEAASWRLDAGITKECETCKLIRQTR